MSGYGRTEIVSIDKAANAVAALNSIVELYRDGSAGDGYVNEGSLIVCELLTPLAARWAASDHMVGPLETESMVAPACAEDDAVEKTMKQKIMVTAAELERLRNNPNALIDRVRVELGATVVAASPVSLPRARKAVAVATDGHALTSYEIVTEDGRRIGDLHPSQAAARAAGIDLVNASTVHPTLHVRAAVTRDNGNQNLVTITRTEPDLTEVAFSVTTSEPRPGAEVATWCVSFIVWS
jgi:hypothetical protein